VRVEHINANERQIAARLAWLLDESYNPAIVVEFRYAKLAWIADLFENDLGIVVAVAKLGD
jgi:hypothetical protein